MSKKLSIKNFTQAEDSYTYDIELFGDDRLMISGSSTIPLVEGEDLEVTLRKTCDNDIEIFVDEKSIGFGALNQGAGMTAEELEEKALTPEAD